MRELALFAGAGGGILGGHLLGWRTVCAVEIEDYPRRVLLARQRDGILPRFPIWDDIITFDGQPWRGRVDVVSGGFPCQDISCAGKGAGIRGKRSGLWSHMARVISEVGPEYVFVENVPALTARGLGVVLGDLATMGYDAKWGVLGAWEVGAPHKRDRIWIVANAALMFGAPIQWMQSDGVLREDVANAFSDQLRDKSGGSGRTDRPHTSESGDNGSGGDVADANVKYGRALPQRRPRERPEVRDEKAGRWWTTEPDVGRVAHGVASRVDRLRALGNGQVPAVARLAWEMMEEEGGGGDL